jgi:hypothetical protein
VERKQVHITLDKIPHILVGRLVGNDGEQTARLTDKWRNIWLDEVFLPVYSEKDILRRKPNQAQPQSLSARGLL